MPNFPTSKLGYFILGSFCLPLLNIAPCFSASYTVTTNADSGPGSLRQALINLNTSSDSSNTINIQAGIGQITLTSNLPLIVKPVTINGNNTEIFGQRQFRSFAFQVPGSGQVNLNQLTIQQCLAKGGNSVGDSSSVFSLGGGGGGFGGGICFLTPSPTTLSEITFVQNKAKGGDSIGTGGNASGPGAGGGGMLSNNTVYQSGSGLDGTGGQSNYCQDGGFGGGGSGSSPTQFGPGKGGFGGGGGGKSQADTASPGGKGGFGGGGGAAINTGSSSLFAGGDGSPYPGGKGGGGAALGGSIFVYQGQQITLRDCIVNFSSAEGGIGFENGESLGQSIFVMAPGILTFDISSGTTILSSGIEGDQGAGGGATTGGGLIKTGPGTLELYRDNTYVDTTTINEGTLLLKYPNTFAVPGKAHVVLADVAGANLSLERYDQFLTSLSGGGPNGGNVTLSTINPANLIVGADGTNDATYGGVISGRGSVIKEGSGTWTLTNAHTYTGVTIIEGGRIETNLISGGNQNVLPPTDLILANKTGVGLKLGQNSTFINISGGGPNGGDIETPPELIVGSSSNATYGGKLIGASSSIISKIGQGTWTLSGSNPYQGEIHVQQGILKAGAPNILSSAKNIELSSIGQAFDLNGHDQTVALISGTGDVHLGGATLTVKKVSTSSVDYKGNISGSGGLVKDGPNPWRISGNNTYTGSTKIIQGTLEMGAIHALPPTTALILENASGATLDLRNYNQTVASLTGGGALGGNINLGTAVLTVGDSTNTSYGGNISGTGGITKQGTGTLTLNQKNTYTGVTTVNQGTIIAGVEQAIPAQAVVFGTTYSSKLDLNGFNHTFANLAGGASGKGEVSLGNGTLKVGDSTNTTYGGIISGDGNFVKQGSGTLTLSGQSTYKGSTTIEEGVLKLLPPSQVLPQGTDVILSDKAGALLDIETANTVAIKSLSGGGSSGGNVKLGALSQLQITGNSDKSYAGIISGTGGVDYKGTGIWSLSGKNTYTGPTLLQNGTIRFETDQALSSLSPLKIESGGKLDINQFTHRIDTPLRADSSASILIEGGSFIFGSLPGVTSPSTYVGNFQGNTGEIHVEKGAEVHLVKDQPFAGQMYIEDEGFLGLSGDATIGSSINISPGGIVKQEGDGILNLTSVYNEGELIVSDRLLMNGSYTQTSSGTLKVPLKNEEQLQSPTVSFNEGYLDGTLNVEIAPGIYEPGQKFPFFSGLIHTPFADLTYNHPEIELIMDYSTMGVGYLVIKNSNLILPDTKPPGNAGIVQEHVFRPPFPFEDPDFVDLGTALLELPAPDYIDSLNQIGPGVYGALSMLESESSFQMSQRFFLGFDSSRIYRCIPCFTELSDKLLAFKDCSAFDKTSYTSVWIAPLCFSYRQNGRIYQGIEEVPGFNNTTSGVCFGLEHEFLPNILPGFYPHATFGIGASYLRSKLLWNNRQGDLSSNSFYLGPYFKVASNDFYLHFLILAGINFYEVHRNVSIGTLVKSPQSSPISSNLCESLRVAKKFETGQGFFVEPQLKLDFVSNFQKKFSEKKGDLLNLEMLQKTSSYLKTFLSLKIAKEFYLSRSYAQLGGYIGFLQTTPIQKSSETGRLKVFKDKPLMSLKSYDQKLYQPVIGLEAFVSDKDYYQVCLQYELKMVHSLTHSASVLIKYRF